MLDGFTLRAATASLNAIPPSAMVPPEDFTAVVEDLSERSTLDTIADMPEFSSCEQARFYNHLYETGHLQKRFSRTSNASTAKELSGRDPLWAHPKRHQEGGKREAKRVKLALHGIMKATIAQLTPAPTPQVGHPPANLADAHERQCSSPSSSTFTFTALTPTNPPPVLAPTISTNTIIWDPTITPVRAPEHQIIHTPAQVAHGQKRSFEVLLWLGPPESMQESEPLEMTDEIFAALLKSELAKMDAQNQY